MSDLVKLDAEVYDEIVRRLLSLRELTRHLADAYDEPVSKKGADEMRASLDRVLELLGRKIDSASWPSTR